MSLTVGAYADLGGITVDTDIREVGACHSFSLNKKVVEKQFAPLCSVFRGKPDQSVYFLAGHHVRKSPFHNNI